MNSEELCLLGVVAVCIAKQNKKINKKRTKWVKSWLARRAIHSHTTLLNELRLLEPDDFRNYLRMNEDTYAELLNLITPIVQRQYTILRKPITPHERLSCTLRFLATGRSFDTASVFRLIFEMLDILTRVF